MQFRKFVCAVTGAFALLGTAVHAAAADAYPQRAVRLIMPYPPGGAGDIVGRLLSARSSREALGQQIVIDNRGGGAQVIATEIAAKAPPDGYTLFLASATHSDQSRRCAKTAVRHDQGFRADHAGRAVRRSCSSRIRRWASPSIKELIAAAKAQPGRINYASSGPGTGGHLSVELLKSMAGIDLVHMPYKGAAPALVDVIGGPGADDVHEPAAGDAAREGGQAARAGDDRAPSARSSAPDIPTVAEAGSRL